MLYDHIAEAYEAMEATTKRLEMLDHLVSLLKETPPAFLDKLVYLTQGKLYPDFMGVEIGIADKMAARAIALATGADEGVVNDSYRDSGDLGLSAEALFNASGHPPRPSLTVESVYRTLDSIAQTAGVGSVDAKLGLFAELMKVATPREAKYLVRTVTGKLRLGVADMTIIDGLAAVFGRGKEDKTAVERAYNICSDLGQVASTLAAEGVEGIAGFKVRVGNPIRPMLAERLPSATDILEKIGGECAAEYKYDGERVQVHKRGEEVMLFSRRLENITEQYPDVAELVLARFRAREVIAEAETVAVDLETGDLRPFQELMHRRRKHGIQEAILEYPIAMFFFDCLYRDGEDLTTLPYPERRRILEEVVDVDERARLAIRKVTTDPDELERFFEQAIADGCEGLICKTTSPEGVYRAGGRGWQWIKYKRDYKSEMTDTVDLVAVGALHGRGRRAGSYGALLLATYDPATDMFRTITKCGAGFTDANLAEFGERFKGLVIDHRHPRVEAKMIADVWFVPSVVMEVLGAEVTLSPIHPSGMDRVRAGAGLAIRFPRFTGNFREDKAPEDATTEDEVVEMYESRLHGVRAAKGES